MSRVGKATKSKSAFSPGLSWLRNERGYAYVMVLAMVVILAILAEAAFTLTSYRVKRDKEEELLFRGTEYIRAIQSYYLSYPRGTFPLFPRKLEDLLNDPRYPNRHYLRILYKDPFGGDWLLVKAPDGGISGVVSQCQDKPMKVAGFLPPLDSFDGAQHYSDWMFVYKPPPQGQITPLPVR